MGPFERPDERFTGPMLLLYELSSPVTLLA